VYHPRVLHHPCWGHSPIAHSNTCIYFEARFGSSWKVRGESRANGRTLARLHPVDADAVVPVLTRRSRFRTGYYAAESRGSVRQALICNHYVGRTFIEPSQEIRDFGVKPAESGSGTCLKESAFGTCGRPYCLRGTTSRKKSCAWSGSAVERAKFTLDPCPPTISPLLLRR